MPRTLIDLASHLSEEPLDIALDSAIRAGMWRSTFLARFDAISEDRLPGTALLRKIIRERETEQGLTGSAFERRLLRLLREAKVPTPICQYRVEDEGLTALIDFAYPEFGIAIEADGYRWHDGRTAFERDRLRLSESSRGWRVLQITWLRSKYDHAGVLTPDPTSVGYSRHRGSAPRLMYLRYRNPTTYVHQTVSRHPWPTRIGALGRRLVRRLRRRWSPSRSDPCGPGES